MDWPDVLGKRLGAHPRRGRVRRTAWRNPLRGVRTDGRDFVLDRGTATPFPLRNEWAHRARLLSEMSAPEVLAIIGDAHCFHGLLVGSLPQTVVAEDVSPTGLNWNDSPRVTEDRSRI